MITIASWHISTPTSEKKTETSRIALFQLVELSSIRWDRKTSPTARIILPQITGVELIRWAPILHSSHR